MSQVHFIQARLQTGLTLQQQGRTGEAANIYREILRLDPNNFDALHLLGVCSYQGGRHDEALDLISGAIRINPNMAFAHANRGAVLSVLQRFDEALISYKQAIALNPGDADAHYSLGGIYHELGRLEEGLAAYKQATDVRPDFAEAWFKQGLALQRLKRPDEALASYGKVIAIQPDYAEAWSNRGNALKDLKRFDEAIASFTKAIARKPMLAETHCNLGAALHDNRQFDEALASFDTAIALKPGYAEACYNRGLTLKALKRFDEAIASFKRAVELKPDYADAFLNKAFAELATANFADGWKDYEWRNKRDMGNAPQLTSLSDAAGRTVLVHWEQGLGDTIHFCRYVQLLKERNAKILFAPQPSLKTLLQSLGGNLVDIGDPSLAFDFHIPLMSLPGLFGTDLQTVPAATPYLFADPYRIEKWKNRMGSGGFKIGICWKGNSSHKDDAVRSFSVGFFKPLADIAGVRLISLAKGEGEEQLKALPDGMAIEVLGDDFDAGPDAFADTAAVMMNLDLVITADTSIAHLAGALGVPVWVALRYVAEWRWLTERPDSPWYPTMRLFRQTSDGDWKALFEEMQTALVALINNRRG